MPLPFYDPYRHGVTFSLLSTWKECREKARLSMMGLTPRFPSFALTFGTVVHEILAMVYTDIQKGKAKSLDARRMLWYLKKLERTWKEENPTISPQALQDFEMSLLFSEAVLPTYFEFWEKDLKLDWVSLEGEFRIPWKLPDGTVVFLRGKRDGVFRNPRERGLWLLETKTKSRIDEGGLVERIAFEEQVNIYLTALSMEHKERINGVLYNILRRPQLRQGKSESIVSFARRCAEDVRERKDFYFLRLEIGIGRSEVEAFRPELEATVWDFVRWWKKEVGHYKNTGACENKYGTCAMLPICASGNTSRFFRRPKVFSELGDL